MLQKYFYHFTLKQTFTMMALGFVSACAMTPKSLPMVQYHCERGTHLQVVMTQINVTKMRGGRHVQHRTEKRINGAQVMLADGHRIDLSAQKVATGFLLTNPRYTLRGDGEKATWIVGKMAEEQCIKLP